MSEDNLVVGHYASHSPAIKWVPRLELESRKEIMELIDKLNDKLENECDSYTDYYGCGCGHSRDRITELIQIKNRLNSLWGNK